MKKIHLFLVLLAFMIASTGCSKQEVKSAGESKTKTIRIGIQQSLGPLLLAKEKGWFEKEFAKDGVKVQWIEFQSGPPHFEAMASNNLDFGAVGNSPVISAQAAGIDFKEISKGSNGEKGDAILVPKDSSIHDLKDLKGKKIAVAKGSSGFNFLYKALEYAGLKASDIEMIQLQPDEAQAAFETKKVDAWAIWEPFISYEVIKKQARVIADGEDLHAYSPGFVIARTKFIEKNPDLTVKFLKVYEQVRRWQNEHFEEAVDLYAKAKKLDKQVVIRALQNNPPLNEPITEDIIQAQQQTADFQYEQKVIKTKIDVSKVVDNRYINKALQELKKEGEKQNE
ncbi:putative aliphatic sulfonates-binding protein [Anoxybacillus sp. P3H1B]|uniref:Putative aliphatic sulfonates-binding protein n=2 Tax=Bacillales TaxID=1385 RepID=A0ABD5IS37_9BACL|nr:MULTISPECIES: aliphatic sulfonate ABC transporter substrate-binding protein [Anoxybacillus]KXG11541.1 putative aliphatic sulfonates-binding protein [Anoxybacillus sp. P3H1B]MED5051087.1 aliphatic sulfonate ABC transporter substrate-binding protein [Anoxybacillus rupiensis]OQM45652.1 sulfonate ABC transporter substrate-binding protein [Anoxybacillus sp. UARK-01]